jgi:hypothetical protein
MAISQFTWTRAASRMNEILTGGLAENCRAVEVVSLTVAAPTGYGWPKVLAAQDCFTSFS